MNFRKCLIAVFLGIPMLFAGLAHAGDSSRPPANASRVAPMQGGPSFPPAGDDQTTSLGSFKIRIVDKFTTLMSSCPNYNATTKTLSSPTLYDGGTIIGRSDVSLTGHDIAHTPFELGAVNIGTAGIVINKDRLLPPPMYPCFGDTPTTPVSTPPGQPNPDHGPCAFGTGTRKVDTEIRSLNLASPFGGAPGTVVAVRAGKFYSADPFPPPMPPPPPMGPPTADIMTSPGKVESRSGPSNNPGQDFPASSFFNVYAKVDIPPGYCGPSSPPITLYNVDPLKVVNKMIFNFPPRIVYLHDASSIVPILFLYDGPPGPNGVPLWSRGEVLGYFLLAGHGVNFGSSSSDVQQFNSIMQQQTGASCPIP
ncbi:MAG TPA: hypothetical protein VG759_18990 [Candidatus Angelobacter sp.]|jgi:hypothetical protein|nr:hypothetical protein [Candidatus Angelobacter sp.]